MNIQLDIPIGKWRYFTQEELAEINRLISTSSKTHTSEIDDSIE
jgi:23S rRNA pseudouridine2604 synthase